MVIIHNRLVTGEPSPAHNVLECSTWQVPESLWLSKCRYASDTLYGHHFTTIGSMKKLWNENGPPLCKCGWYAHLCWHQYCLTRRCTAQGRSPACYLCTQPHLLHPPEASTFITLYGNTLKVSHYATQEQPCHRRLSTIWLWRGGRGQYPLSGKNTQNSIWNAL